MIQFNLRWLAYIFWGLAFWWAITGTHVLVSTWNLSYIGPTIGQFVFVRNVFFALILSVLGWLIWKAFS